MTEDDKKRDAVLGGLVTMGDIAGKNAVLVLQGAVLASNGTQTDLAASIASAFEALASRFLAVAPGEGHVLRQLLEVAIDDSDKEEPNVN